MGFGFIRELDSFRRQYTGDNKESVGVKMKGRHRKSTRAENSRRSVGQHITLANRSLGVKKKQTETIDSKIVQSRIKRRRDQGEKVEMGDRKRQEAKRLQQTWLRGEDALKRLDISDIMGKNGKGLGKKGVSRPGPEPKR